MPHAYWHGLLTHRLQELKYTKLPRKYGRLNSYKIQWDCIVLICLRTHFRSELRWWRVI